MAFSAGLIWHNWSTGATTNGGGFNPTNANFATDLAADTNTGNTASPVVSSASYNFVAGDVGHWLFIPAGANSIPGWYLIASVASNKATLTAGIGTAVLYGTSVTGRNYQRPQGLNTAVGIATSATPTGLTWGIDYSQNTTARISFTDMVIGATTTDFTSVLNPIGVNMIGNVVNVTSGTGFTVQRIEILSIPASVTARCDKSLGTTASTGGNGSLGGAIGSSSTLTALTQALVGGNKIFIKATGTYTLTVTTTVTAGVKGDVTSGRISVEGYTTYPGERDGRPVITSATNSVVLLTLNDNDFFEFTHLKLTHTAATRGAAFTTVTSASTPLYFKDLVIDGVLTLFNSTSFVATVHMESVELLNTTSATAAISATVNSTWFLYGCDIHDNAAIGFRFSTVTSTLFLEKCIFDTNSVSVDLQATASAVIVSCKECVFVDNTSDGLKVAANSSTVTFEFSSNIFYGNGGYGVDNLNDQAEADALMRINRTNAYGSNTPGPMTGLSAGFGDVTLTADPFTSRAGRDFSLNNTAGGGAALRAKAFPVTFPAGTTANYRDVGPVQRQDVPNVSINSVNIVAGRRSAIAY